MTEALSYRNQISELQWLLHFAASLSFFPDILPLFSMFYLSDTDLSRLYITDNKNTLLVYQFVWSMTFNFHS